MKETFITRDSTYPEDCIKVITDDEANFEKLRGMHTVGYLNTSYNTLNNLFLDPTTGISGEGHTGDYKQDAEWVLLLRSGLVFSIFNFKNGPAYHERLGGKEERKFKRDNPDWYSDETVLWNIGGRNHEDLAKIRRKLTNLGFKNIRKRDEL